MEYLNLGSNDIMCVVLPFLLLLWVITFAYTFKSWWFNCFEQ